MIEISLVPPDDLENILPHVEPMLDRALHHNGGRFRLNDLYMELMRMEQTLWVAFDEGDVIGCCTVKILHHPTGLKVLSYEYLGGKAVHLWLKEGHKVLSQYAREFGCTLLEVPHGRKGWEPFLSKLGYRQTAVRYEVTLED